MTASLCLPNLVRTQKSSTFPNVQKHATFSWHHALILIIIHHTVFKLKGDCKTQNPGKPPGTPQNPPGTLLNIVQPAFLIHT
jgi:hypothetical protein